MMEQTGANDSQTSHLEPGQRRRLALLPAAGLSHLAHSFFSARSRNHKETAYLKIVPREPVGGDWMRDTSPTPRCEKDPVSVRTRAVAAHPRRDGARARPFGYSPASTNRKQKQQTTRSRERDPSFFPIFARGNSIVTT